MTTIDARELDAGPELDERVCVALRIPGRTTYFASDNGGDSGYLFSYHRSEIEVFISDYRQRMPDSGPGRSEVCTSTRYPRVSEDMGAAWLVVEAMETRGFLLGLEMCEADMEFGGGLYWHAEFQGEHRTEWVEDETAPLAICRAALAVMEGE